MESTTSDYNFRFQSEIQGLRGIAVILVVLYHAGLLFTGGFIGVDVFFVISGYVITGSILHQAAQNKFSWASFVERRVRRLLPSLSAMIVLTLLMGVLLNPISTMEFARRTGVAAILVNANHYLLRQGGYFDGAAELNPFLHTWSLSVEEQFYIVFPIVVILSIGATFKLKRLRWVLWTLIALSAGLSLFLSYTPEIFGQSGPKLAFFLAATRSWEFGIGALLALAPKKLYSSSLAWIGLAGVIASAVFIGPEHIFPGVVVFIPVIATALLIAGGRNQDSLISKSLSHPYLVRIGDVSYGWYLWHWPIMVFAKGLNPSISSHLLGAIGVFTLGLAFLNERWLENPIRYSLKIRRLDWRAVTGVSLAAPVLAFVLTKHQDLAPSFPRYAEVRQLVEGFGEIGCDEVEATPFNEQECRWGTGQSTVLIVGDSNARQHIPAFKEISGYRFVARTWSGCPLSTTLIREGVFHQDCATWTKEVSEFISILKPDIIILSVAYDYYGTDDLFRFMSGSHPKNREETIKGLQEEVIGLKRVSPHSTWLLMGEITKYRRNHGYVSVYDCSVLGIQFDLSDSTCTVWTDLIPPVESSHLTPIALHQNLIQGPRTRYFRDGGHLNPSGARQLIPFWERLLSRHKGE